MSLLKEENMQTKKYLLTSPENTKENIEAIYEELSLNNGNKNIFQRALTIKSLLFDIDKKLEKIIDNRKEDKENEYFLSLSLKLLIFVICIVCIYILSQRERYQWVEHNQIFIKCIFIFLNTISVLIELESIPIFKKIWSFGVIKALSSLLISGLFIFCTSEASALINFVFPIDASAFPYTKIFIASFLFFHHIISLLIISISIIFLFKLFDFLVLLFSKLKKDSRGSVSNFFENFFFIFSSSVFLIFNFFYVNVNLDQSMWHEKTYILAHMMDFNNRYACSNLNDGYSVIFLGDRQDRVLVDYSYSGNDDFGEVIDKKVNFTRFKEYKILPCND